MITITLAIFLALIINSFYQFLKNFDKLVQIALTVSGKFLAIIMGFYFNRIENATIEHTKTVELIEAGIEEIKNCQSLLGNGYLTELAKYDGKYRQNQNVTYMGNSLGVTYPFPSFLDGFCKNELLLRNTSFLMQSSIQYALHNMNNTVLFMNENNRYKGNKDEQFLQDYRDYYSFFSYCFQILKTELNSLKNAKKKGSQEKEFRRLTKEMIDFTQRKALNEFLNIDFKLHVAVPSELLDNK
ncbi:hypothetical protein QUH73_18815 [Labilibaculum sp. K2S]|uniref:hypothetical protein n=1 Tax=Labilibaculum sp. K2S TaxID=3056386 RepID=UPI0025A48C7F|nr:hypothetical protein [Labilibaculum sp. K2S]MDM8161876.1 hypothetical protein [Labilibaculum sp. K2S]